MMDKWHNLRISFSGKSGDGTIGDALKSLAYFLIGI
jgi:hypothetical protein